MQPAVTSPPPSDSSSVAWQLIRDDVFDRFLDDAAIERLVAERAAVSATPHADVVQRMVGMTLDEVEAARLFGRILTHRHALASALGRPVHVRVAALDLLTLGSGPRRGPRESRPIMVAPAFLERALEEASLDAVTALPRVDHFMRLLDHELLQRGQRVAVAFLDLDGFKQVNDLHGHGRGDEVLRTLAEAARSVLRRGDVVARVGGDEFALMLVGVSPDEARAAVDRLRARFEALTRPLATSFSAGIVHGHAGATAAELVAQADRAMYEDKRRRAAARR